MHQIIVLLVLTASPDYTSKVVGVSDGDTLTVLKSDKTQVKIRLHGVDSPETGQDFGARAKQEASGLAFGKTVTIRPRDTDRYGRTVAEVILPDGQSLNRQMVWRGYAWWYRSYAPNDRDLEQLESAAKTAKRGLWSQPSPVPPWSWRKGDRVAGSPVTPPAATLGGFIGNRRSMLYHSPSCRGVAKMNPGNKVPFATAREAEAEGYKRAGDCR